MSLPFDCLHVKINKICIRILHIFNIYSVKELSFCLKNPEQLLGRTAFSLQSEMSDPSKSYVCDSPQGKNSCATEC